MKQLLLFYLLIPHFQVLHGTNLYLGCFIDRIGDRDLNVFISDEMPFTVDQCLQACQLKGFLYAAIQYGNECRCGNQFGKYGQVSDDQCHYRCPNSLEICGGNYRNSIYRVVASSQTDVRCERNLIGYQGCYVRQTLPLIIGKVKTVEECVQMCAENYLYAGIRNQEHCHCGEELNGTPANSSLCHQQCSHSVHEECCGGENVLSVYQIHYYQSEPLFDENPNFRVKRADVFTGSTFVSTTQSTFAPLTSSNAIFTSIGTSQSSPSTSTMMTSTQFISSLPPPASSPSSSSLRFTSVSSTLRTSFNTDSTSTSTFTSSSPTLSSLSTFTALSSSSPSANASTVSNNISATTVLNLNTSTTTTTTTPSSLYIISTIFLIYANQSFDPSTNQSRESIRQGLTSVINLAFRCRSNLSYPNCTQARQTRQTCSNGYTVNLLTNLVQVASGNPAKYKVDYSVVDLCDSGRLVSPTVVRSATDVLTRDQITTIFGFQFDGAFIQSTALSASTTPPVVDQKLWLIGATLGPVAFVLLLIFFFCYLHYKCRPRQTSDKRIINPPTSSKYPVEKLPPIVEKARPKPEVRVLAQRDPLVGHDNPVVVVTKDSSRSSPRLNSIDIPLDELRHQNDVERWRNKIRLQEKYQPSPVPELKPAENVPWQPVSRLNELIYQETPYDPDSDLERRKRRQQRRRSPSVSNDPAPSHPHVPIVAHVNERPAPNLVRLHHNPYEAADRVQALSRFDPVPFTPKYSSNGVETPRYARSDHQTTPTLFIDVPDRAETAINAYGLPKRQAKTRVETDREAMIREDEYRTNQRQHVFADDGVHVNPISKNYRDEYRIAKASVMNTKKLISNIQDDLQQIVHSDQDHYHA